MKKPFKIYYSDTMIQTITTEDLQGDYVVVTDEMAKQISNAISSYQVIDKKIVNIKKQHKKRPTLQFTDKFDVGRLQYCWSTEKNNMFNCETSHLESPKKFNTKKYSWVKYDS